MHADTAKQRLQKLSTLAGEPLVRLRFDSRHREEVLRTNTAHSARAIQSMVRKLQADLTIEYAVVDGHRHAHAIPFDPLYSTQWHLQAAQPAAIAAVTAWDITRGSASVVVAVLDTGVRVDHPDLPPGKLLPGYDFVSGESNGGFLVANDGDGWDADPSDPGDWVDAADRQTPQFRNCTIADSSWHGTRVAGMIGAATDNNVGIAGAGWNTSILPVRVLGKCGGFDSDILSAMRWAAGLRVDGVPDNPNPAKILNMSLGSTDPCTAAYQSVIQELRDRGVLVVISAGNEGGPVDAPANCPGAFAVAGLRHAGTKVGYSNLGLQVAIAAPAGNCPPDPNDPFVCTYSLTTTTNAGLTGPIAAAQGGATYTGLTLGNRNIGTSFSAPLAAGVAALMASINSNLSTDKIRARMREGATPFPIGSNVPVCHVPTGQSDIQNSECTCTTATCGAGMLNAENAVRAAQRPIAQVALPTITPGASITFDAAVSTASQGRTLTTYAWAVTNTCGNSAPVLAVTDQPTLIVNAPTTGSYVLQLVVTDNTAAMDTTYVSVDSATAVSSDTAPSCPEANQPPMSSSDNGGGAFVWQLLVALLGLLALRSVYTGRSRTS